MLLMSTFRCSCRRWPKCVALHSSIIHVMVLFFVIYLISSPILHKSGWFRHRMDTMQINANENNLAQQYSHRRVSYPKTLIHNEHHAALTFDKIRQTRGRVCVSASMYAHNGNCMFSKNMKNCSDKEPTGFYYAFSLTLDRRTNWKVGSDIFDTTHTYQNQNIKRFALL